MNILLYVCSAIPPEETNRQTPVIIVLNQITGQPATPTVQPTPVTEVIAGENTARVVISLVNGASRSVRFEPPPIVQLYDPPRNEGHRLYDPPRSQIRDPPSFRDMNHRPMEYIIRRILRYMIH